MHAANIQERAGAKLLLETLRFPKERLALIWRDAGYWGGKFPEWVREHLGARLEVISRNQALPNRKDEKKPAGFVPLPRRWVVERQFAWQGRGRRLSKDYEQNPASSEAWIYLSSAALLLNRLA